MTTPPPCTHCSDDVIYELWDTLAAFPASDTDTALVYMLDTLCRLIDADTAYWLGAIRVANPEQQDRLYGWRPRVIRYLHQHEKYIKQFQELAKEAERTPDPSLVTQIQQAGTFRANLKRDLVPPDWFESSYHDKVYGERGITDTLFVTLPINSDCEAYIGLQRKHRPDELFTHDDLHCAARALRGLTWFQHRVSLSYGLMISETPLTPVERNVLKLLLTEKTEKAIAKELGQTPATTHTYVRQIYRKLGIRSRAALTALWLGG